tara:strand:+ start:152 stop:370 length:219 start_codon:yes stop_codon:yes gene_type:complete
MLNICGPTLKDLLEKVATNTIWIYRMINDKLVEILLAAILVSSTYDKDQPVIKWGGIVIAVAGVASALFGKI